MLRTSKGTTEIGREIVLIDHVYQVQKHNVSLEPKVYRKIVSVTLLAVVIFQVSKCHLLH